MSERESKFSEFFSRIGDWLTGRYRSRKIKSDDKFNLKKAFYKGLMAVAVKLKAEKWQQHLEKKIEKADEVRDNVLVKYVCKELFLYFLVCFLFFVAIFFVNQLLLVIETLLKKHVPFWTAARLILYYMPAIIAQSSPFATLVGFLMCLGRMVTDNEILILRASGQKYSLVLLPVLIMGVLISAFSFLMNDYFLPIGNMKSQQLTRQIAVSNPAVELEPNSVKRMDNATIVIGQVDKTHVSDMIFFDTDKNGQQRIIVAKDSDVYKSVSEGVLMQLVMNDADVVFLNQNKKTDFDVLQSDSVTMNIFADDVGLGNSGGVSPREMTAFDLRKRIDKMKSGNSSKKSINSYELEFSKKFSIPFGSIFFAMLAFPLALVFGKKDGQTLGLVFGILISVGYWAVTIMGQMFGLRNGANAYFVTWLPNAIIGFLGIILYMRLKRK